MMDCALSLLPSGPSVSPKVIFPYDWLFNVIAVSLTDGLLVSPESAISNL